MNRSVPKSVRELGLWSAIFSTVFGIAYILPQLLEWGGLLGSAGGPESSSTPFGTVLLLAPSFFLAFVFVVLMVSVHHIATPEKAIWSHIAVVFASIYATLVGLVYFTQLTLVVPRLIRNEVDGIEFLLFVPFNSFLYAVDILGYSLMCLSMLFAAPIFKANGLERFVRWSLIANGVLIPFVALQMYLHALIFIAALWAITFPLATGLLALLFERMQSVDGQ